MIQTKPQYKHYPAQTRGQADHGWLKANFSFSFAGYYDPERIQFGMLRVLNDDYIAGGRGFGMHPHDNMEIITIPLQGALAHKDSMGNASTIEAGDVQVMSAGTGVMHSEFNPYPDQEANTLQIWLFPNKLKVEPRYDQKTFRAEERHNRFQTLVSPDGREGSLWIHQNAFFSRISLEAGKKIDYPVQAAGNGVYVFLIEGMVHIANQTLQPRDALGIQGVDSFSIEATSAGQADVLLLDVPMTSR